MALPGLSRPNCDEGVVVTRGACRASLRSQIPATAMRHFGPYRAPHYRPATGQLKTCYVFPAALRPFKRPDQPDPRRGTQKLPPDHNACLVPDESAVPAPPGIAGRGLENGKAKGGRGSIASRMQPRLSQRQAVIRRFAMRLAAWSPRQCRGLRDSPQWLQARQRRRRSLLASGPT